MQIGVGETGNVQSELDEEVGFVYTITPSGLQKFSKIISKLMINPGYVCVVQVLHRDK